MRHLRARSTEGEDAEVGGVIEIDGDCLYVALADVAQRYPIVWPASTSWDSRTDRVILPGGESIGHGDAVHGGGGYRSVDDVAAIAGDAAAARASECVDNRYGEIAVVNNQPDGIRAGARPVEDEQPSVDSSDALEVEGDWLVEELTVDGERVVLGASQPVTVTIEGGMISGTAACNQYTGAIDWSAEAGFGRFGVSDLRSTKRACGADAMEIEQAFFTALQAVDSFEAADGLYVAQTGTSTNFHLVRSD
ncbi:MAG: META domain-containing protein [Ilumatobacter sp.]|uniref:META domain-containing protein n=1 Tax=Ilumatobacter sp. TaxID=1967498 RepID=UPI00262B75E2|nr:META domain-containing protein [Ilumatobacter sp.]MDJ0768847.1 META domain-containing protein [Ilumatobacter sp.]